MCILICYPVNYKIKPDKHLHERTTDYHMNNHSNSSVHHNFKRKKHLCLDSSALFALIYS